MQAKTLLVAVAVAGVLLAASGPFSRNAYATERYWDGGGDGNNWSSNSNWTDNLEPTSSDWATIGASTGGGVTPAAVVITNSGESCSSLRLGRYVGDSGTVQMESGDLSVGSAYIGSGGIGAFIQAGGTHTLSSDLYLGYGNGSHGDYALSDGILDVGGLVKVGSSGTGTFTQTGGIHTINEDLSISGSNVNPSIYRLHGGSLAVTGSITGGVLDWTGGMLQVGGTISKLALGYETDSNASYSFATPFAQSVSTQYVGYYGRGSFAQTGRSQCARQSLGKEVLHEKLNLASELSG